MSVSQRIFILRLYFATGNMGPTALQPCPCGMPATDFSEEEKVLAPPPFMRQENALWWRKREALHC